MALDLDAHIAACTALNQSYCNPAERVMSTLNLGLQLLQLQESLWYQQKKSE